MPLPPHVRLTDSTAEAIREILECEAYDKAFVLCDAKTREHCLPRLGVRKEVNLITIPDGDDHKDLHSLQFVWETLQHFQASRRSLLICLGGGMVTDLGGFAAATFKRGMDFVNVPTTLLAMVDAAVGGKTGVNLGALKNEIGCFKDARRVIVDTHFLETLDERNLRSGYAEMLKHSLLKGQEMWARHLSVDLTAPDAAQLLPLVGESIGVKAEIVAQDPTEKGLRKALNLGHTIGHALETLAMRRGQAGLHGYFVAWGLIAELYISHALRGFPADRLRQTVAYLHSVYGDAPITCKDYDAILELMLHDKKNAAGRISMTLLDDIGAISLDAHPSREEIFEALDFLREGQ